MATYYTASYNMLVSSISTSSAGAVAGISYALPGGGNSPAVITWTVTADGSAQSSNLEGSNDDSSWSTLDSNTAATGGTRTFGPTGVKFVRISQVSRTGGTATTATLITDRGTVAGNPGTSPTGPILAPNGSAAAPSYSFSSASNTGFYQRVVGHAVDLALGGINRHTFNDQTGLQIGGSPATMGLHWSPSSDATVTADLSLLRDGVGILAQRVGTNTQTFRLYRTFTDASNYERLAFYGTQGVNFSILTEFAGTGTSRQLSLGVGGVERWALGGGTSGNWTPVADNSYDIGTASNRPRSIYAGTSFLAPDGSAATPSISFASETGTGLYRAGATDFRIAINTSDQIRVQSGTFDLRDNGLLRWGSAGLATADTVLKRTAAGQVGVGSLTVQPVINGTLTVNTTSTSTGANTTETDLFNYSLPAGALNANGRGIRITAWGTFAANGNNKTVKVYFGASSISTGVIAANNKTWQCSAVILRTGAATQIMQGSVSDVNGFIFLPAVTSPTETLSGAVTIRVTGQNGTASAGDITGLGFFVETIN